MIIFGKDNGEVDVAGGTRVGNLDLTIKSSNVQAIGIDPPASRLQQRLNMLIIPEGHAANKTSEQVAERRPLDSLRYGKRGRPNWETHFARR